MSARVANMEALVAANKLGVLIKKLLPTPSEPLNFCMLRDATGLPFRTSAEAYSATAATMKDWMEVPHDLHPIARALETDPNLWRSLLMEPPPPSTPPFL